VNRSLEDASLDDQQHLTAEIDLERASKPQPRLRHPRRQQRPACPRPDETVAADPLPALERNHRIASLVTEDAIDPAATEVTERDEPPLQ
jgi:hypothetical protein